MPTCFRTAFAVILSTCCLGCFGAESPPSITLATTTSTQDSGLLDVLLPRFQEQTGIVIKAVAVGSGQAIEMARRGDADVLLSHAPKLEEQFMKDGYGVFRKQVMHNDFVIVGPQSDPAGIEGIPSVVEAFRTIRQSQTPFVSRADKSGTHQKEKRLWKEAGLDPQGNWYIETGSGQAESLRIASEKRACMLSDRATFLAQQRHLDLVVLCEGDPLLRNPYHVLLVSPQKHPHIRYDAARRFADFLLAPETQKIIGQFGAEQHGRPLFIPDASAGPSRNAAP